MRVRRGPPTALPLAVMGVVWRWIGITALLAAGVVVGAVLIAHNDADPPPETSASIQQGQAAGALTEPVPIDHTLALPDRGHRVVYVLRGHRVDLHASPGGPVIETVGDETEFGSPHVFAVTETEGRWVGVPTPLLDNGVLAWIRLDDRDLGAGYTRFELLIDLSDRRAELWKKGEAVRAFTVSVGAPGSETPTGRFAVTDVFRRGLNPSYGCCAVALTASQPNLPSGWLGGNRIAIHGTSGPLGLAISSGCVRAADRDVDAIIDKAPLGAPVTVRD